MKPDRPKTKVEIYEIALRYFGAGRFHQLFGATGWEPGDAASEFYLKKAGKLLQKDYQLPQILLAMRNFLLDRFRAWQKNPPALDFQLENLASKDDRVDPPVRGFPVLQEAVDLFASLRPKRGGIDYGAVVLLSERIKVLVGLSVLARVEGLESSPAEKTEQIFPWGKSLQKRRVRKDSPSIQEAWEEIVLRMEKNLKGPLRSKDIAGALKCTISVFEQWRSRARKLAEETFGKDRLRMVDPFWASRRTEGKP